MLGSVIANNGVYFCIYKFFKSLKITDPDVVQFLLMNDYFCDCNCELQS